MNKKLLKSLGKKVFSKKASNSEMMYPDCYDCCIEMKNLLENNYDLDQEDINIREVIIDGNYRHYVLEVDTEEETLIVDLTFGQFAEERQGRINLGKKKDLEDVIVISKSEYIFANEF
jgi:hypothetical protein